MWRCDVTATSCCSRRLSTCRTIAVTIIVSPPSVRLPTASCCHLQENNEQYMACERKHFEGRLKFISRQAFNPGHLAWAASALPLSDINQTTISLTIFYMPCLPFHFPLFYLITSLFVSNHYQRVLTMGGLLQCHESIVHSLVCRCVMELNTAIWKNLLSKN